MCHCLPKYPRLVPDDSVALRASPLWDCWPITATSQQVDHHLFLFFFFWGRSYYSAYGRRQEKLRSSRQRQLLLQTLRPRQRCLRGRTDGSCVCACSCLPLSRRGASPLFPHRVPEVSGCPPHSGSLSLSPSDLAGRGAGTEREQEADEAAGRAAALKGERTAPTCTCTRPPFVVQRGDSRLSCKHGASKHTVCLAHRDKRDLFFEYWTIRLCASLRNSAAVVFSPRLIIWPFLFSNLLKMYLFDLELTGLFPFEIKNLFQQHKTLRNAAANRSNSTFSQKIHREKSKLMAVHPNELHAERAFCPISALRDQSALFELR